jgi:hypothetical protein
MGKGWWVNGRTGETIEVFEHASEVIKDPTRFGYTSDSPLIQAFRPDDPQSRRDLLKDVVLKGWIRIRFTGGRASRRVAELWSYTNRARDALDMFLTETGAWDTETVEIHELRPPGRAWVDKVKDIKYTYEPVESQRFVLDEDEPTGWRAEFGDVDKGSAEHLIGLLAHENEEHPNYSSRFWFEESRLIWECVDASPSSGVPTIDAHRNTTHRHSLIDAISIAVGQPEDRETDLPQPTRLMEASLGRVYQHWLRSGFGIVSADRGDRSEGDNVEWRKKLKNAIREAGFGFVPLEGTWVETDSGTGEVRRVTEASYLVPSHGGAEALRLLLLDWGKLDPSNPQEAVTLVHPGGPVEFIDPSTNEVLQTLEEFHPDKVSEIYSRLTRRPGKPVVTRPPRPERTEPSKATTFTFESWQFVRPPGCWSEALARSRQGEIMFISEARRT